MIHPHSKHDLTFEVFTIRPNFLSRQHQIDFISENQAEAEFNKLTFREVKDQLIRRIKNENYIRLRNYTQRKLDDMVDYIIEHKN